MSDARDRTTHEVVGHDAWVEARKALLAREKELSRVRDELAAARRALPWERVTARYVFDGPDGERTLGDLFERHRQLVVYHFMFGPTAEVGCKHCSFWADHFDATRVHLAHRDTALVVVSRAPYERLAAFQRRMGWRFPWLSSGRCDFNVDLGVSFTPEAVAAGAAIYNYTQPVARPGEREGMSVFYKDDAGAIFHTYSAYARGIDLINGTYNILDLTPKGRDEAAGPQQWVRHHDAYED